MQVRMAATISGLRDGAYWPAIGEVINLPDEEAVHMLNNGQAKPVTDVPETASVANAEVETAAVKK